MSTRLPRFPGALKAVRHLKKVDPVLAEIIEEAGPARIQYEPGRSIYESLARSVVYQQIHGKAAASILKRVQEVCGTPDRIPPPEALLQTPTEKLRGAGLSQSKLKSLLDLAARVSSGELPTREQAESMSDEEIIEALTVVRGIGPWTVQMMLIFNFGRPDVLPVTDFGVRNGFTKVYRKKKMIEPKQLEAFGERWRPYRSVASWYFWRATELERFRKKKS